MRVGIVSFEFEGATKNGGIGTAYRLLAETLAASGAEVTVLLTQQNYSEPDFKRAQSSMRKLGIEIEAVPAPVRFAEGNPWFVSQSMAVCERLRAHRFDIVHFPENIGAGYYAVLSKKLGLGFANTLFVAGLHGPTSWVREASADFFPTAEDTLLFELEKRSVELADIVVSPSQYMLDYTRANGWKLPRESIMLANVNRLGKRDRKKAGAPEVTCQLVFFGRLEHRKGIYPFVNAVKSYLRSADPSRKSSLPLVFVGKDVRLRTGQMASDFVRRELAPFGPRIQLHFKSDLSSAAALSYLRAHPESLVCMPSPVDNSPYVIVEALEEGLNFIASQRGGQRELIHESEHERVLFEPTEGKLAEKFTELLYKKARKVRPADGLAKSSSRWVELHRDWLSRLSRARSNRLPLASRETHAPLVSVCIAPTADHNSLQSTIESLDQGMYSNVEILTASRPGARLEFGGGSLDHVPSEVGKPWMKRLAAAAKGKYVLFLDGTSMVQPNAIPILVELAESCGKDRLCSGFQRVTTDQKSQMIVPTPEQPVGALLRVDPRSPLVFHDRKQFLEEYRSFGGPKGEFWSEQALWVIEATLRGKPLSYLPRTLVRVGRCIPAIEDLVRHQAAACKLLTAYAPAALSGLATGLIREHNDGIAITERAAARERALELVRKTFTGIPANA